MKIRLKLTLIFTIITMLILVAMSIAIYYFFSLYRQIEFYDRLNDRAVNVAHAVLGVDDLTEAEIKEAREKNRQYLPEEIVELFDADGPLPEIDDSVKVQVPENFVDMVSERKYVELKSEERQAVAIWYKDNMGDYIVIVSAIDQFGIIKLADLRKILVFSLLASIFIIFFSGRFFSRHALTPITSIIQDVNRIGLSNLHLRLETRNSKDEIAELATTFNSMLERMETSLEIQRNFISNASHELKNPLTAIIGEVELALSKERSAHDYKTSLQTIAFESRRMDHLISKLLNLAQTGFTEKVMLNDAVRIDELIISVHEDLNTLVPDNNVHINFESMPEDEDLITIKGNMKLLHAALVNVMENACKFSDQKMVDVLICVGKEEVKISVTDQGIGIGESDLENIFQPFYRANNARAFKGSGIGLSITEKIIRMHGGDIQVTSVLGEGTQFEITFPQENITSEQV